MGFCSSSLWDNSNTTWPVFIFHASGHLVTVNSAQADLSSIQVDNPDVVALNASRFALLVNDLGSINIDAELIENDNGDMIDRNRQSATDWLS